MRVLLTAAGSMRRWTVNGTLHLGVPKHLAPVNGEPMIARQVRLLNELSEAEVVVVGPDDDRYRIPGSTLYVPDHHVPLPGEVTPPGHDVDKFLSSRELWCDGRTLILHGDTFITEDDLCRIVHDDSDTWTLYARFGRHQRPFHKLETFGYSIWPHNHPDFDAAFARLQKLAAAGRITRTGTWDVYRALCGAPTREIAKVSKIRSHPQVAGHTMYIGPPSTDIDRPEDYDQLVALL